MIWIIGGTSEALKIRDELLGLGKKMVLSTTTSYGSKLSEHQGVILVQKMLQATDMLALIDEYSIDLLIDASHPFALQVSKNAIAACRQKKIPYLRFERKNIRYDNARYYPSYESLIAALRQTQGNIFLTIGSKNVNLFSVLDIERLTARVLPDENSIALCRKAGLLPHQIIAMKGRMKQETNKALFVEYETKHLISKDSGESGGMNEKVKAADELGILVHIIERPALDYDEKYSDIQSLRERLLRSRKND
ncbi:MAG: precorrin-6A reductase [Bacteroidia bacterium]|nr:MAG: precorrin-6A reductase [Bacteroidia bacterium]